jgi:hypothetical protein
MTPREYGRGEMMWSIERDVPRDGGVNEERRESACWTRVVSFDGGSSFDG